jgi:predicted nucleotidyltransferase
METEIKQIVDKIIAEFKPEKVVLFGSYAWGTPGVNSDLDLLIIKDDPKKNTREMAIELEKILIRRNVPLDLIVYKPEQIKKRLVIKDQFISKIMTNGKILYGN